MKLTRNKILAVSAVILSVFAVVAGSPIRGKKSYINPKQFADSLIAKKQNLTVVDLRNKKDYDDYHIPSAVNVKAAGIDPSTFDKKYMIVFYSGRDNISKAIQYKFEKEGFDKAYFLSGGIDDWMNKILFPALPKNFPPEEKKSFERIERRSMYFGGHPQREDKNYAKKVYRREGC
jgi:rhodanese-related sulfurtransferase